MITQYLVADVGGTNTRVALANDGKLQLDSICRYRNEDQSSIQLILQNYLQEIQPKSQPVAVCIDLAGPVDENKGILTNLDWTVTTAQLCDATGAKTGAILNDMQAQGLALSYLPSGVFRTVLNGTSNTGSRLVINVGTGFNSALILEEDSKLIVPNSETGHVDLPVSSHDIFELHQYLTDRFGFASVEEVLSGRGLGHIYDFLNQKKNKRFISTSKNIIEQIGIDPLADEAMATFLKVFGCVCGNLALTHLPLGGIYLVGGMAQALTNYYANSPFQSAFIKKGRFSSFMKQFSVHLVQDDHAALLGCISYLNNLNYKK